MAKALTERWPISPTLRKQVIARLRKVLNDPRAKHREATAASRALIAADAVNIELEQQPEQHLHLHQHNGENPDEPITILELSRILGQIGPEETEGQDSQPVALDSSESPPVASVENTSG